MSLAVVGLVVKRMVSHSVVLLRLCVVSVLVVLRGLATLGVFRVAVIVLLVD